MMTAIDPETTLKPNSPQYTPSFRDPPTGTRNGTCIPNGYARKVPTNTTAQIRIAATVVARRMIRSTCGGHSVGIRAFANASTTPISSASGRWYQAKRGPTWPVRRATAMKSHAAKNTTINCVIQRRRMTKRTMSTPNT